MTILDIKAGKIEPDLLKSVLVFFVIYIACNCIGLSLDTVTYYSNNQELLFSINVVTLLLTIVLIILLFLKKTDIKFVNPIFFYPLALNLLFTDIYNIHHNVADWQTIIFRNGFVYTISIISAGLINGKKPVIILSIMYLIFIISAVIISETNFFTENSLILMLAVTAFSGGTIYYMQKLQKTILQKTELQKIVFEKDIELLNKKNELELAKSIFLEKSIDQKNKELTTNALIMAQHFELQKKIQSEIKTIHKSDKKQIDSKLANLNRELSMFSQLNKWDDFQKRFEDVHVDFYKTLNYDYPELSPTELKLAALLKLGLSSKEIAAIMQNTNESIHVARSRLRKKLNLETAENLNAFLNKI